MATQKQILDAYRFARARLVSGFLFGLPDGREIERRRPSRPLVFAVAVAVLLLAVFGVLGFFKPGAPKNWDNGKSIVIDSGSGTRFVVIGHQLHPTLNLVSARLLTDGSPAPTVRVKTADLGSMSRGLPLGIAGAPDDLPDRSHLLTSGFAVCTNTTGSRTAGYLGVRVGTPLPAAAGAYVAGPDDRRFLVYAGHRYPLAPTTAAAVVGAFDPRASGAPDKVSADWLNTLPVGVPIHPLKVTGSVAPTVALPTGVPRRVATVVRVTVPGSTSVSWAVVTPHGLAQVTATEALLLGGTVVSINSTALRGPYATDGPHTGLPSQPPTSLVSPGWLCSSEGSGSRIALSAAASEPKPGPMIAQHGAPGEQLADDVYVRPGWGAVTAVGTQVALITDVGARFPLDSTDLDTVSKRLGLSGVVPSSPARGWVDVFADGPTLSTKAATREWPAGTK